MRRWLLPALLLAALIGAWQLAASSGVLADVLGLESFLVPSPAEIAESLWENRSLLAENAWVTLREILLGFACAARRRGRLRGRPCTSRTTVRHASYPLLVASQTIPILVARADPVVWFGYGIGPKLAIVALICFFPITVNTLDGLRSVDPEAIKLMRTPRRLALADLPAGRGAHRPALAPSPAPRSPSSSPRSAPSSASGSGSSAGLGHLILQDNAQLEMARDVRRGRHPLRDRPRPLRPARPRRAARRHLAIEHRG